MFSSENFPRRYCHCLFINKASKTHGGQEMCPRLHTLISSPGRVTTTRPVPLTLTSLDAFTLLNFTEGAEIFYGGCIY